MSSSVCHAPLPARMEAFTTRMCLRAVDQYERLLHSHFTKPSSEKESPKSRLSSPATTTKESHRHSKNNNNNSQSRNNNNHSNNNVQNKSSINNNRSENEENKKNESASLSAINAFRQWRRNIQQQQQNGPNKSHQSRQQNSSWPPASQACSDNNRSKNSPQFPSVLSNAASTPDEDLSLKLLALNALELTAPASDVLLKNRLNSWFQLSGHPDGFAPAGPGTVWKRHNGDNENTERRVYEALSNDPELRDCIPRFYREVEYRGERFIELQDLLFGYHEPHVVDIKLGTRTFLESEVAKTQARSDLYAKMVAIDPNEPTPEEHEAQAVTKVRYMQFRERESSSHSHGFRIEAMKLPGCPPITDLKTVKSHKQLIDTMGVFLHDGTSPAKTKRRLLQKLRSLRAKLEASEYFATHEVIGSSIFMIYDNEKVGVWLIDFAKTYKVPEGVKLTHRNEWQQGNHEEGFLFGLDNLIKTIDEVECWS